MTTDEALAIAARRGWALVPVAVYPRAAYRVYAEHCGRDGPAQPEPLSHWWIAMKTDEGVAQDVDGRVYDTLDGEPVVPQFDSVASSTASRGTSRTVAPSASEIARNLPETAAIDATVSAGTEILSRLQTSRMNRTESPGTGLVVI